MDTTRPDDPPGAGGWSRQSQKIRTTIDNGLERRPKRTASAQTFLRMVLPALDEAIARGDQVLFRQRFGALTATCHTCHEAEQVAFVHVSPPT